MPRPEITPDQKRFYDELGRVFFSARIRKGYEQEDVAQHLGMSRSNYSNIERGTQRIYGHHMIKLIAFLDISVERIPKYVRT